MELAALNRKPAAENELNWVTATFMALFHVGAVVALFFFTWKALLVSMFLWWVSGSLGIGMGYHRLLTHRGYRTPKWVEYCLTVCATLALEGGPIFWVATHRIHHAHPVSARHGIAWYEVDLNWYGIWALKKLGLARHVYRVKLAQLPPTPVLNTKPDSKLHLVPGTSVSGD